MYAFALKLLQQRDQSIAMLRRKVESKFGTVPDELIQRLLHQNFLNDRRFAENYVARRKQRGRLSLQEELKSRGIAAEVVEQVLAAEDWPSLPEVVAAKMNDWKLRTPLHPRDAARLFRALLRLGYDEDAVLEEIQQLRKP